VSFPAAAKAGVEVLNRFFCFVQAIISRYIHDCITTENNAHFPGELGHWRECVSSRNRNLLFGSLPISAVVVAACAARAAAQQVLTTESFFVPFGQGNPASAPYQDMVLDTNPLTTWGERGAAGLQGSQSIYPSGNGYVNDPASTVAFKFNIGATIDSLNTTYGAGNWAISGPTLTFQYTYYANNPIFGGGAGSFETYWVANDSWAFGDGAPSGNMYAANDYVLGTDPVYATTASSLLGWAGSEADLGSTTYNWLSPSDNPNYSGWTTTHSGANQGLLTVDLTPDAPGSFVGGVNSASAATNPELSFYLIPNDDTLGLTIFTGGGNQTPEFSFNVVSVPASTWTGQGGDANWTTAANWGGTAPPANNHLDFAGTTSQASENNFAAGTQFNGITFSAGGGAFVLGGNAINLGGDIINSSSSLQTLNLNLVLQQNINLNAASGDLLIGGNISGAFGVRLPGAGTVTLAGANSYAGGTTVSYGTLVVAAAGALPSAGGLSIGSSAAVQLNSGIGTVSIQSLTINSGGTLDVGNSSLVVSDDGNSAAGEAAIQEYIEGGAIVSSYAAANGLFIAYADGTDGVVAGLPAGQILVEPALAGDTDLNGLVNIHDLQNLLSDFNQPGYWDQGNFNGHADVDISDLQALLTDFNTSAGPSDSELGEIENLVGQFGFDVVANPDGRGFTLTPIPEPASCVIGLVGLSSLALRRRRALSSDR
jgi:autotransporter-associated beta strand protein